MMDIAVLTSITRKPMPAKMIPVVEDAGSKRFVVVLLKSEFLNNNLCRNLVLFCLAAITTNQCSSLSFLADRMVEMVRR